jgi:hypothetical protein
VDKKEKKKKKITVFPAPSCPPVGEEEEKEPWPGMFPKECQECGDILNREMLYHLLMSFWSIFRMS